MQGQAFGSRALTLQGPGKVGDIYQGISRAKWARHPPLTSHQTLPIVPRGRGRGVLSGYMDQCDPTAGQAGPHRVTALFSALDMTGSRSVRPRRDCECFRNGNARRARCHADIGFPIHRRASRGSAIGVEHTSWHPFLPVAVTGYSWRGGRLLDRRSRLLSAPVGLAGYFHVRPDGTRLNCMNANANQRRHSSGPVTSELMVSACA